MLLRAEPGTHGAALKTRLELYHGAIGYVDFVQKGPALRTCSAQAMRLPSGDQAGLPAVGKGVRISRSLPVAKSTTMRRPAMLGIRPAGLGPRMKAIWSPFGDHAGWA